MVQSFPAFCHGSDSLFSFSLWKPVLNWISRLLCDIMKIYDFVVNQTFSLVLLERVQTTFSSPNPRCKFSIPHILTCLSCL
jgi:hypothetical protein